MRDLVNRLPSANGGVTRLASLRTKEAGIDPAPLLKKAGLNS